MTTLRDITDSIGKTDAELNMIIQKYLDGPYYYGDPVSVGAWRILKYKDLRRAAYAPVEDYADAEFKIRVGELDGQAELDALDAKKAAIKQRFTKK